jgi:Double zinc ribbon
VILRLLAATAPTTTADDDLFGGVDDFFDSGTWLVIRNLSLFFVGVFWLASAYWVYKDARRRIDDPWLVAVATVLGLVPPFIGPIIYLFFRPPEYLEDVRERELEIKAMEERLARPVLNCPVCRAEIDASYLVCPVCTTKLKQACSSCRAPLEPIWQICPYCETPVDTPSVVRDFEETWDEPAKPKSTRARSSGGSRPRQRRTSSGSG